MEEIFHAIEADNVIDPRHARDLRRVNLRVAAGHQHLGTRAQPFRAPHQLPRLPIGAVGYRAAIDNVAIRRLFERDKRMVFFQAVLDNCRIILIDFAAQGCNGYFHFVQNVNVQTS